jgi:hypothetical protein
MAKLSFSELTLGEFAGRDRLFQLAQWRGIVHEANRA